WSQFFFFQAEDGIRDFHVTGVQTCALPISKEKPRSRAAGFWGKDPGDDLLSHAGCTLPSARLRFTSEFGMGSGGSTKLLSPGRRSEERRVGKEWRVRMGAEDGEESA